MSGLYCSRICAVALFLGMSFASCMARVTDNKFFLKFVDSREAAVMLSTPDKNTDNWGKFDIEARMGRPGTTRGELL